MRLNQLQCGCPTLLTDADVTMQLYFMTDAPLEYVGMLYDGGVIRVGRDMEVEGCRSAHAATHCTQITMGQIHMTYWFRSGRGYSFLFWWKVECG